MVWSLAEAKNQFSEVVRRAVDQGPQTISIRGEDKAVVISKSDYDDLRDPNRPKGFKDLLKCLDLEGVDLTRDQTPAREVDL